MTTTTTTAPARAPPRQRPRPAVVDWVARKVRGEPIPDDLARKVFPPPPSRTWRRVRLADALLARAGVLPARPGTEPLRAVDRAPPVLRMKPLSVLLPDRSFLRTTAGALFALFDGTPAWFLHGTKLRVRSNGQVDAAVFVQATQTGGGIQLPLRDTDNPITRRQVARIPRSGRTGGGIGWPALVLVDWVRAGGHAVVTRVRPAAGWLDKNGRPVTPPQLGPPGPRPPGEGPYTGEWSLKLTPTFSEARQEFETLAATHRRLFQSGRSRRHLTAPVAYFVTTGAPPADSATSPGYARLHEALQKLEARLFRRNKYPELGYLLTTYANGGTLEQAGLRGRALAAVPILAFQLLFAVASLHVSGIVHGDLNAGNILLRWPSTADAIDVRYAVRWNRPDAAVHLAYPLRPDVPEIQIIDFGASQRLQHRSSVRTGYQLAIQSPITATPIRPPEHLFALNENPAYHQTRFTARSDTWALGLTLLQLGSRSAGHRERSILNWAAGRPPAAVATAYGRPDTLEWRALQGELDALDWSSTKRELYRVNILRWRCVPPASFVDAFATHVESALTAARVTAPDRRISQAYAVLGTTSRLQGPDNEFYLSFYVWNVVLAFGLPSAAHYGSTPLYALLTDRRYDYVRVLRQKLSVQQKLTRGDLVGDKGIARTGWVFDDFGDRVRFRRPGDTAQMPYDGTAGKVWNGVAHVPYADFFSHHFFDYGPERAKQTALFGALTRAATRSGQYDLPGTGRDRTALDDLSDPDLPRPDTAQLVQYMLSQKHRGGRLVAFAGTEMRDVRDARSRTPTPTETWTWAGSSGGVLAENAAYLPDLEQHRGPTNGSREIVVGGSSAPFRYVNVAGPQLGQPSLRPWSVLVPQPRTDDPTRLAVHHVSDEQDGTAAVGAG